MNRTVALVSTLLLLCAGIHLSFHPANPCPPANTHDPCIRFVSKAFSPNGDGINDVLNIQHSCDIEQFSLKIYDRSNQLLHEHRKLSPPWNGMTSEGPLPQGHYRWLIEYSRDDSTRRLEGNLSLIR